MSSLGRLELGKAVRCVDGPFGELADVVIDPVKRRVTHLVVKPLHHDGLARLVPIEMATGGDGENDIALACTADEAGRFTTVRGSAYVRMEDIPKSDRDWDIGVQDVLAVPYDSPELGVVTGGHDDPVELTYDRVPKGEVEIRRSSPVISADDHLLGHVEAFLTDDGAITHVVLEHGHLWGRRDVTIPVDAVAKVETDSVTLRLSKDEAGALPSVRVRR